MQRFLVAVLLSVSCAYSHAQDTVCRVSRYSFKTGEEVSYRAYYNWKFIWLKAADILFTVSDTVYGDQPAYHFVSKGWSLREYDWFFKVRDNFEAIVSKDDFRPLWFLRDTYEGGFKTYNRYEYNYAENLIRFITYNSDRPFKDEYKKLQPCTFDVLSAIYYCRNLNFNQRSPGEKIPLTMAIDNEIFHLYIRYWGKESLKLRDGSTYRTIKFSVMLVEGTIFKGGEDMTVWVSDDSSKVPVMVEAKILIGSVKAILSGTKGLVGESLEKVK